MFNKNGKIMKKFEDINKLNELNESGLINIKGGKFQEPTEFWTAACTGSEGDLDSCTDTD